MNHTTYAAPALNVAIGKTRRRLVPLMFAMYFVAFIDRVNVGFAKRRDGYRYRAVPIRLCARRGDIFAAYALFGIPANLLMNRWGAKRWLSATTALWGAVGLHRAGDQRTTVYRPAVSAGDRRGRVLPRILLLASIYFPNKVRASVIGIFVLGVPAALTLGSPLSGALLEMHGVLGKPGWFWMFVLEGLPAVALGVFAFSISTIARSRPAF